MYAGKNGGGWIRYYFPISSTILVVSGLHKLFTQGKSTENDELGRVWHDAHGQYRGKLGSDLVYREWKKAGFIFPQVCLRAMEIQPSEVAYGLILDSAVSSGSTHMSSHVQRQRKWFRSSMGKWIRVGVSVLNFKKKANWEFTKGDRVLIQ